MNKKMKWISPMVAMAALAVVVFVGSCSKSDAPPPALTLVSLTAGSIDLNGATSATGVPAQAAIIATFSTDLDPTTATDANITFVRDYDQAVVAKAIVVSGKTLTITPSADLNSGSLFDLSFTAALKSKGGKFLDNTARTFTT